MRIAAFLLVFPSFLFAAESRLQRIDKLIQRMRRFARSRAEDKCVEAVMLLGAMGAVEAVGELAKVLRSRSVVVRSAVMEVLGTFALPETERVFAKALKDRSGEVRVWAARGLARLRRGGGYKELAAALRRETNAEVRQELLKALADAEEPSESVPRELIEVLVGILRRSKGEEKKLAAAALAKVCTKPFMRQAMRLLAGSEFAEQRLRLLARVKGKDAQALLLREFRVLKDGKLRGLAAEGLARLGARRTTPALIKALKEAMADQTIDYQLLRSLVWALGKLATKDAEKALKAFATVEDEHARIIIASGLLMLGEKEMLDLLLDKGLKVKDDKTKLLVLEALGCIKAARIGRKSSVVGASPHRTGGSDGASAKIVEKVSGIVPSLKDEKLLERALYALWRQGRDGRLAVVNALSVWLGRCNRAEEPRIGVATRLLLVVYRFLRRKSHQDFKMDVDSWRRWASAW